MRQTLDTELRADCMQLYACANMFAEHRLRDVHANAMQGNKKGLYTSKGMFIHSFHRVIHKSTGKKGGKIADLQWVIHIVHRLSTVVIHMGVLCGNPCG